MAWTSHGYYIDGSPTNEEPPPFRHRCGGFRLCQVCTAEAEEWHRQAVPMTDKFTLLENEIAMAINSHSLDSEFGVPDYILAEHMIGSLKLLKATNFNNQKWHKS